MGGGGKGFDGIGIIVQHSPETHRLSDNHYFGGIGIVIKTLSKLYKYTVFGGGTFCGIAIVIQHSRETCIRKHSQCFGGIDTGLQPLPSKHAQVKQGGNMHK